MQWQEGTDYVVKCEDCNRIFYSVKLSILQSMMFGTNTSPFWSPQKQPWYLEAAEHWATFQHHQIGVWLVNKERSVKERFFDLTKEWATRLQYEPDQSKKAMLREIEHLRSGA